MESAKDKTVIMISHRLSTTKDADRIYLLHQELIIDEGTHEQLMELDGMYAEMYNVQAESYQ
ncbi:hypothetical protein [Paenibacillus marinisediminis]